MPSQLLIAVIGLAGVVVGALANAFGTTVLTKRKFLQDSRYDAYILFLNSLALAGATVPGSPERWKGVAGLIEAKSRISLFGSRAVVEKLSAFSAQHARVDSANFHELAEVIRLMRVDVGSSEIPDLEGLLRGLLFEVTS